jgi:hypothetical protein
MAGVVGNVMFEKDDLVATAHQRTTQTSPERRMTITPGGAD